MKNVHPCTFFIDEFEAKPQTSLLLTGCQCFQAETSFSVEKLVVQECARTHILEQWHPCRFACEVEQPVKQLYIRVQLLNDKFF